MQTITEWNVNRFYSRESFLLDCRIYDVIKLNIFHAIGDFFFSFETSFEFRDNYFQGENFEHFLWFFSVSNWFWWNYSKFVQRKKANISSQLNEMKMQLPTFVNDQTIARDVWILCVEYWNYDTFVIETPAVLF